MEKCGICGVIDLKPYYGNDKRILQCKKCGVVFLAQDFRISDLNKYYGDGNILESRYKYLKGFDFVNKKNAQDIKKIILKYIKPAGKKLLDVGANTGFFVAEAVEAGFDAIGIEPNKFAVGYASRNNIPVKEASVHNFSFDYKFDVITILSVLEHLEKPAEVLEKLNSYLVDGGILVVEVPNIESYASRKRRFNWKYIVSEHIFHFSPKTLSRVLENNGFKIISVRQSDYYTEMGVRECLKRIFGINPEKEPQIDRFKSKSECLENTTIVTERSFPKELVRKTLLFLVKLLGREEFIVIIAQKLSH